ncbi:MAG: hypothetical protein RLZZ373_1956 [Pseudomonadota bacterium]
MTRFAQPGGSPAAGKVDARDDGSPDFWGVLFHVGDNRAIRGARPECTLQAGDVLLWNSRMSCASELATALQTIQVLVPRQRFEQMWPGLALQQTPRHLHAGSAMLALAHAGVQALWKQRRLFSEEELQSGLEAVVDLIGKDCRPSSTPSRSKSRLFDDILRYIDNELENPALTPTSIACRHGCSVRSLQTLFAERQRTVAGYIRQRRLERCRQALCKDGSVAPIGHMALQWGFGDAAHFSKLFKSTYGMSPRQYRQQAAAQ